MTRFGRWLRRLFGRETKEPVVEEGRAWGPSLSMPVAPVVPLYGRRPRAAPAAPQVSEDSSDDVLLDALLLTALAVEHAPSKSDPPPEEELSGGGGDFGGAGASGDYGSDDAGDCSNDASGDGGSSDSGDSDE